MKFITCDLSLSIYYCLLPVIFFFCHFHVARSSQSFTISSNHHSLTCFVDKSVLIQAIVALSSSANVIDPMVGIRHRAVKYNNTGTCATLCE